MKNIFQTIKNFYKLLKKPANSNHNKASSIKLTPLTFKIKYNKIRYLKTNITIEKYFPQFDLCNSFPENTLTALPEQVLND
ncbi:hypothetical protein GGC03_09970 [Vibrio sp. THAF191c]|nr:hypothetical protein FIU99_09950 [Vibrio sp. THAF64]QGM34661.1 hypothetical protein GGC04_09965 [Vibrio sp. THAF191d]QGN70163.1 hypothetical protein GGC03_09970 [Vibrio sp. THAF191c]